MATTFADQTIKNVRQEAGAPRLEMGDASDSELMERIQSRDERALETIIQRFRALVRSVVERMIPNDPDVSDVVEEVFLGVWKQSANYDPSKGKPIGWIITIARRRSIDRIRRRQAGERAEIRFKLHTETLASPYATEDVEKAAMQSERAFIFRNLLSSLPVAQSAMVWMAFHRGLSHREIARETGIPLGTVKTRLELAVKKLRAAVIAIGSREEWFSGAV
jgi:RNA polymerase sigma-70 factor (ECF subfamily)